MHQLGGAYVEPAFALHRFDDDGSRTFGLDGGFEEILQGMERVVDGNVTQGAGERNVVDFTREGAEAGFVGRYLARERHAKHGAPVKRTAKGDHGWAARRGTGNLDRVLNGLGSGREKCGFFCEIAGGAFIYLDRKSVV